MGTAATRVGRNHRTATIAAALLALMLSPGALAAETQSPLPPAAPATPQPEVAGAPVVSLPDVTVTAPEPRYVAPTRRDRIGRIWAPVLINGQGPFRLVLDTGASRSAVTRRVAETLGLPIREGSVRLRGVTGSAVVASVRVDQFEVGELLVAGTTMPIVADAFGGAEGVLGAEGLADKRIVIEFLADRITVARSHRQPAPPGFSTLPFTFSRNRGMRLDVRIGAVPAIGVIDTGAQMTVGNLALREALARRRGSPEEMDQGIIGVTEDVQHAAAVRVPTIHAGNLIVRNAQIMFTDLVIFDHWNLNSKPAILIGMDVLGVLDTLIIDYRRSELQIRAPAQAN